MRKGGGELQLVCMKASRSIPILLRLWAYGAIMDPYDDVADFSEADRERTLVYFARRPGGNWVCFDHLPDESRDTLYYKYYHNFAGPRGFLKYQSSVDRCYSRLVLPSVSDAFIDVDVPF